MVDNAGRCLFAAVSYLGKTELASCRIEQGKRKPSSGLITLSSLSSLPLPQLSPADEDDKPSELRNSVLPTPPSPLEKDIMKYSTTSSSSLEDGDFRPLPSPPTQLQRPTNLASNKGRT
ncbi:hypothetical protein FRX31_026172 [Thalictrum thalictroides]|uniref:Uncharacterized protein n=1 Tax=Thalictrum thalictroides TaxID=46969 RepID=A0A7J6VGK9_THATH|nr:hypothetical protein FRX31_026172 [Thalictrum thalictroides]